MPKNRTIKNIIKKRINIINNRETKITNKINYTPKQKPKLNKPKTIKIIDTRALINKNKQIQTPKGLTKHEVRDFNRTGVYDNTFTQDYHKDTNVKYDVVILISSFNRYSKVKELLTQLYTQETKYSFKIVLLNDGSTYHKYKSIKDFFPELEYLENKKNEGKYGYWRSINKLFDFSLKNKSHIILQIDDDYILCNNYLNIIADKFFEIKNLNNKNVAISYHRTHATVPNQWGMRHWVDGGTLFDYRFINRINFKIDEISSSRWTGNNDLSSGVWNQVSRKLEKNNLQVYNVEFSLVKHNGNEDSKMNKIQRDKSPITTWGFIDDK